jgi:ubiquinone/menaquinone biosynthesis C-methylase UbiE
VSSVSELALRQNHYYARSALNYDAMHVHSDDEHGVALRYTSAFLREFACDSLLDVGTGTGRAIAALRASQPELSVVGVEPVLELLQLARKKSGVDTVGIACASGYQLPFPDASFDGVCQFGVLHHVAKPSAVVAEMMRVARRGVFISDSNRFGQGSVSSRLMKLALSACGLWHAANLVKTRGTGYSISAGDGLAYSYSVYDSLAPLQAWADRVVLVPTGRKDLPSWYSPLLTSSHVLLCAIRDR